MNLILSTIQIITILLIFEPLITQSIPTSTKKTTTAPIIKKTTTKNLHNITFHTTTKSHPTFLSTTKKSRTRKVPTTTKPVKTTHSTTLTVTKPSQSKAKSYSSLIIVGSITAVIVMSVAFYVLYSQYEERNRLKRDQLDHNGLRLGSISNNLDINSSTSYLNRGIIAFHEVSNEIIENRNT